MTGKLQRGLVLTKILQHELVSYPPNEFLLRETLRAFAGHSYSHFHDFIR